MRRVLIWLLTVSVFAIPTRSWEATSTSQNLSITVTAAQAITAVNLSGSSFTGGAPSGTVVGAISVTMSPSSPPFSGALSLTGTNPSRFQIVGSNLETNGIVPTGTYQINIVATQAGASASPFTQPETITGAGSTGGGGPLPVDRNASANWKMAGLLSVGGIPNRTTQCGATINPRGGGQDDTANIQAAINACPAGQVVQLSAGTFTVAEGNYVLLNKAITVRGAGPGSTVLTRPTGPGCPPAAGSGATMNCSSGGNSPSEMFHISPVGRFVGNDVTPCALTSDVAGGSNQVTVNSSCASMFAAQELFTVT